MPPASFQDLVLRASAFWTEQGCVLLAPASRPLAHCTMTPDIFLRLWDDTPMALSQVVSISRPRDTRAAGSRLRLGHQLHFAAVLRPPPADLIDVFSRSLRALGFELERRDLQLVEEQRSAAHLGVRELGWRVQLDGVLAARIGMLTHAVGRRLDSECVQIVYGLERLALLQQRAESVEAIVWAETADASTDMGLVRGELDSSYSEYYSRVTDVERIARLSRELDDEVAACLNEGLVRPAYDALLECAHLYEMVVARGSDRLLEEAMAKRIRGRALRCLQLASRSQALPESCRGESGAATGTEADDDR